MKHSPRNARNDTERTPALGTAKEYSRAFHGGQEESPSLSEGLIALYQQDERWRTIEAALRLLTSPRGLGFKRAFLFLLDGAGTTLTGVAAAKRPRAVADGLPATGGDCSSCTDERLTALVREIGLPTGAAKENLLLKAMAEGEVHRLSQEELQAALGPAFECCAGSRAVWIVPVPDGHPLGVLLLEEPGRASRRHAQRARLASVVAAHLGKAIAQQEAESAHLESAAKGRALNEAVRDILGATNLPDVLERAMHAGLKATGAGCALLWTFDEQTRELEAVVHLPAERERSLEEWQEALNRLAWTRVTAGGICLHEDLRAEEGLGLQDYPLPLPALTLPLTAFGDLVGVCALVGRRLPPAGTGGSFTAEDEGLLGVLAGFAAVAIANVRMADRVRQAAKQLQETQTALVHAERLGVLGELASEQAREIRPALAALAGFARRLQRELGPNDPHREYLHVILREAKRIGELMEEQEQVARDSGPRLVLCPMNEPVRAAVEQCQEEIRDEGITLEEVYSDQLPEMLLDRERITQMVANILRGAREGLRTGDSLRLETLLQGDRILLEIAHTGSRAPGAALDRLFAPFTLTQAGGPGLGLALAHQIVKEHGGEISVRGEEEWTTIYTVTFPLRDNQERRRQADRRKGADRRRPREGHTEQS